MTTIFRTELVGTTSACAENTLLSLRVGVPMWNYLRVRGEYISAHLQPPASPELPPRARRILPMLIGDGVGGGTTSACAENTVLLGVTTVVGGNYLRVRGEYISWISLSKYSMELPPRARRIHIGASTAPSKPGTTSACAENTKRIASSGLSRRNYLRVRGEYRVRAVFSYATWELPPRARRIPIHVTNPTPPKGTTSACAENTLNELGLL